MSAGIFLAQASAAVELVSVLMVRDVVALAPAWGYLQVDVSTLEDGAFVNSSSSAGRDQLTKDADGIFALVKSGSYEQVLAALPAMSSDVDKFLTGKPAETLKGAIRDATKMAEHGLTWKSR